MLRNFHFHASLQRYFKGIYFSCDNKMRAKVHNWKQTLTCYSFSVEVKTCCTNGKNVLISFAIMSKNTGTAHYFLLFGMFMSK